LVFETLKQRQPGHFRSVPIPGSVIDLFWRILAEHSSGALVWPYSRTTGYRLIKRRMVEANIVGAKACPKGLRHSFAIACISSGIPLTTVKKWLGHARLETTAIYLDASGDEGREVAKMMWK
jgi:integrase/recombinase XerD